MSTSSKNKKQIVENGIKITTFSNQVAPINKPLKRKAQTTAGKAHKLSIQRTDMKGTKFGVKYGKTKKEKK